MNRLLAIDRVSKFACVEFRGAAGRMNGADFLRGVINAFPGKIHTGLGDNGMAFANLTRNRNKPVHAFLGMSIFGRMCRKKRHRASADSALPPPGERASRENEPHDQESHHQGRSLTRPEALESPCARFCFRQQLCQPLEGAQMADALPDCC